jgi:hypothetical protein
MILYTTTDTTERLTPFDCMPFAGVINQTGMTPLTVTQNADETLTFPAGVGVALAANQMMRVELHTINANPTDPLSVQATSTLTTMPDSQFQDAASFLIVQDPDISIPPQASLFTLGPVFFPLPAKYATATFFTVTSEQRHFGVSAQLRSAASAADPGTLIYMNLDWTAPPLAPLQPPLAGATTPGLKLQCEWTNPTQGSVMYGPTAASEICMFVAYYYPSQGPSVCFHTEKITGGANICCPGDPACASLGN